MWTGALLSKMNEKGTAKIHGVEQEQKGESFAYGAVVKNSSA